MKISSILSLAVVLFPFLHAQTVTNSAATAASSVSSDTVVIHAGSFALTKADYEKLVLGFDRASGALATGSSPNSEQSGRDVARLLALVSAAQDRKIDQDPVMQSTIRVRAYALLANSLLAHLKEEIARVLRSRRPQRDSRE